MLNKLEGRNGTREFARRSMKNLDFILGAVERNADVHPVTQTIGALLFGQRNFAVLGQAAAENQSSVTPA